MAIDQRDWYKQWWRKRTGYVERAAFRQSHADLQRGKYLEAWKRNALIALTVFLGFIALAVFA